MGRYLYVGEHFTLGYNEIMSYWAIGYCTANAIDGIIFQHLPSKEAVVRIRRVGIEVIGLGTFLGKRWKIQRLVLIMTKWRLSKGLRLGMVIKRATLLKANTWGDCQVSHAVWDTATLKTRDLRLQPSRYRLIKSGYEACVTAALGHVLCKRGVVGAVLGHRVYSSRAMITELQEGECDVICFGAGTLFRSHPEVERSCKSIVPKGCLSPMDEEREMEEIRISLEKRNVVDSTLSIEPDAIKINRLYLHVFRDSAFFHIDRDRIYADYYEWVEDTIRQIAATEQKWEIRMHPSAKLWGEDQVGIIGLICKRVLGDKVPENLRIDDGGKDIAIEDTGLIVTYAGSIALEAVCKGKRAITISQTIAEALNTDNVVKPKTKKEYYSLLRDGMSRSVWGVGSNEIKEASKANEAIYGRNIGERLGLDQVYRGDTRSRMVEAWRDLCAVLEREKVKRDALVEIGKQMGRGERIYVDGHTVEETLERLTGNNVN